MRSPAPLLGRAGLGSPSPTQGLWGKQDTSSRAWGWTDPGSRGRGRWREGWIPVQAEAVPGWLGHHHPRPSSR